MLRVPLAATAVIAAVLAGWWIAAAVAAERKLAAIAPATGSGNYRITLDFAPERFHQLRLQEAGRLVEVRDRTVYMMDVSPAALRSVAGEYWVDAVERWEPK